MSEPPGPAPPPGSRPPNRTPGTLLCRGRSRMGRAPLPPGGPRVELRRCGASRRTGRGSGLAEELPGAAELLQGAAQADPGRSLGVAVEGAVRADGPPEEAPTHSRRRGGRPGGVRVRGALAQRLPPRFAAELLQAAEGAAGASRCRIRGRAFRDRVGGGGAEHGGALLLHVADMSEHAVS